MRPDPSDIAARRMRNARHGSSARPLKPKDGKQFTLFLVGIALVASLTLLLQNREGIGEYVNRPITKVRMDNQWQQVSESEIGHMITAYMGEGFFRFDVAGVKETLEQHAWIEEASVKRIWPDSLSLQLVERVAIARWGQSQLLNQYGEIFQPDNVSKFLALPVLAGPEDHQVEVMKQFQFMSQLFFSSGLRLSGLTLSNRGSWDLTLNDSMQIAVGKEKVAERLQRFIDFYEGQPMEQTSGISSVDLRYDNGIAIRNARDELAEVAVR
ncbi:MAG: cell division protein FtsQ/DivIB [Gammaproteobacteria bacterium]|nr:cell division protein FtsQ/DivIB [Gammaproteobacteria bacterium]MDD9895610.1 cell division protein FtsQ/DivIB [Gammaproteobacteria bacterium]